MKKILTDKANTRPVILGLGLALGIFGICLLISIQRDREVLSDVLEITKANENRVAQVLYMQMAMTDIARELLNGTIEVSLADGNIDHLRHCRKRLDLLAEKQMEIMAQVAKQDLPPAPLRIWTSKSLRDRYFAERAQLAVLQNRVKPLMTSAKYLTKAFENSDKS
ncbi:hypothetical protein BVX94_01630 [bacterium B17]|nr:hypothetical protein BVX94_01630 [bacterium B17]